jgi:serine phosphatase RsbU (regulator of sigma subunit)
VTAELGAAESMDEVVAAAVEHLTEAVGAAVSSMMVREGDALRLIAGSGLRPGVLDGWRRFPLADANPASEAARTGRPVVMQHEPGWEEKYPSLRGEVPEGRSIICLPLSAGGPVGVLGLTFEANWSPGPRELDLLTTFAEACGQAIRRVEAAEAAAGRQRQLAFLARASAQLSRSLDYRATLADVARLAVPDLADWCAVDVYEGNRLTTLAVAHVDPAKVAWAWELQRRYPPSEDSRSGAAEVARTGRSQLIDPITDEMLVAAAQDEEHLRLARELALRTAIVVPLAAAGRTLGAITLIRSDDDRPYGPADLLVAEDLGRRAGIAVQNARLHGEARDTVIQLQRAVLPEHPAQVPGWELAAHYEPGGAASVGGDFYDAVELPGGRLALCVGDVMGHGVPAAAAMAQVRASVRALVTVDPEPAAVLANLQRMFTQLRLAQLVTLVLALVDPADRCVTLVSAGHHAPLLVRADGSREWLTAPRRRLLGADPDECRPAQWSIGPGDILLLFTDGLVERRAEVVDVGLARLGEAASDLRRGELGPALARLVARMHSGADDDVTALAVRFADPLSP